MIKIKRLWEMPQRWTFDMKFIQEFFRKYCVGRNWIDPFNGWSDYAEVSNDINPRCPAHCHMDALEFLKLQKSNSFSGTLYDPPYSLRQLKECYSNLGLSLTQHQTMKFWSEIKNEIARILIKGAYAISFGWNSVGMCRSRNFKLIEIILVCHGGHHNDTIITVERFQG